ncbi:YesL family protein [Fredinandcohnia sp. 179-A 10B2 NHS]|uniref:YesL family protein n=1 Tax=Fredinandcohnia sp. 179-A 10B2 NHS TaxID=3235176 RepID=UPI0039A0E650
MLNRAYTATEWITRIVYINLLWISFSFLGLVFLGFFPATISMFTVIRKWLMGDRDIPVFRTFWKTYQSEFIRGNVLGVIIWLVAGLLVLDLVFIKFTGSSYTSLVQIPVYMLILVAGLTTIYIFPVYVHYNLKLNQIIKNSFFLMLINPLENTVMIASLVAIFFVVKFIPGFGFFFAGSLSATVIMATCLLTFKKADNKKANLST